MVTYYVHPEKDLHVWVSRAYKDGRRMRLRSAFQIDFPGRWYVDEYNCHVDGMDFPFQTFEDALMKGAEYWQTNGEPYEFVKTNKEYEPFNSILI